ncbi:Uncharacterized membrane protein [Ruminococcaceae bacterium YRB3002]|nr:Uncharacterized membrane protein [Ruminococcaceae bacterium YRB3002]
MDNLVFFPLLAVMVIVTYLIRAVPFVIVRKKITNPHLKAFLDYIPYAVLSSMTFPAILYSTDSVLSAAAGLVCALILSWRGKSLLVVAIGTCLSAFAVSLVFSLL